MPKSHKKHSVKINAEKTASSGTNPIPRTSLYLSNKRMHNMLRTICLQQHCYMFRCLYVNLMELIILYTKVTKVQTGPCGPPSLLYNGYRVSFQGLIRPGRGASTSALAEVDGRVRATHLLPLWAFVACSMVTFTFTF